MKRILLAILVSLAVVLVPEIASADVVPSASPTAVTAPVTTPVTEPYAGGYSPGDTGNWSDMSEWFGSLITAMVLGPFAWLSFTRWIKPVLFDV